MVLVANKHKSCAVVDGFDKGVKGVFINHTHFIHDDNVNGKTSLVVVGEATLSVLVVKVKKTVDCLCFFSGGFTEAFCRSASRGAKCNPLSKVFEEVQYALDNGGLACAGATCDNLHAVFNGLSHRFNLVGVQGETCLLFKAFDCVLHVNTEICRPCLQGDKATSNALLCAEVGLQCDCTVLSCVIAGYVAKEHHIFHIVLYALIRVV